MRSLRSLAAVAVTCVLLCPAAGRATVHRVVLDGPVDPVHAEFVVRAIDVAERDGSDLILLELDTPGGLVDSMESIIRRMLASKVPVCAYVFPPGGRAASAGFFLLESADVAAMAPGTRAGAAHPVLAVGGFFPLPEPPEAAKPEPPASPPAQAVAPDAVDAPDAPARVDDAAAPAPAAAARPPAHAAESTLMSKVREDAQAFLRGIAERRGHDTKAAELAVTESRSYTDGEALSQHLVDVVAASESELLAKLDGREVRRLDGTVTRLSVKDSPIVTIEPNFRERALAVVVNGNVAFLLLLIGALLIYVEVTHAGLVLPGVIGGLCLLLAVTGFSFLPVNLTGVLLVLAAIGLFVAEFTVQGMGILGIAAVACLALGGIMLVDVPGGEGIGVDPGIAIGAALGFGAIVLFLTTLAMRVLRRKVQTGREGMVGLVGDAVTDLSPRGKVFLRGEYWDAVAERPVPKGARVRCTGLVGLLASVEPVDADGPGEPGGPAA